MFVRSIVSGTNVTISSADKALVLSGRVKRMETAFGKADYEGGVVSGIQAVTRHLTTHFPRSGDDRNELPDKPVVL